MKYFVLLILTIISSPSIAQEWHKEEVIQIENDTLLLLKYIYDVSGNLCEKRYLTTIASKKNMSKDDMFMQGIRPYERIDSIIHFVYDENWTLVESISIADEDSIEKHKQREYQSEQISIINSSFRLEGKANESEIISILIENQTPQNFNIDLISTDSNLKVFPKTAICLNRSKMIIQVEVRIPHGIVDSEILISNSNGHMKKVSIQTIGYDLIDENFVDDPRNAKSVKILGMERLFIKIKSNEKLLLIENSLGQKRIPMSMFINGIGREHFCIGVNVLKLVNLSTNDVRYSKIELK